MSHMKKVIFNEILSQKLKGENITELARKLDIPKAVLFDWIKSRRKPNLSNMGHIQVLADYLGITLEEIIFGEKSKPKKILTRVDFSDGDRNYQISIKKI